MKNKLKEILKNDHLVEQILILFRESIDEYTVDNKPICPNCGEIDTLNYENGLCDSCWEEYDSDNIEFTKTISLEKINKLLDGK